MLLFFFFFSDFGLLKNRLVRRQSEESSSSLIYNKSEPGGFVSYLSHYPTDEEVPEEDVEVTNHLNTNGTFKNRGHIIDGGEWGQG